jgi:hypothetical protein
VQEFFLRAGLADDELDIVHQQHVEAAQAALELDHLVLAHGLDEFDHEALGRAVEHPRAGPGGDEAVGNGVEQMRLALAGRALEVEARTAGFPQPTCAARH